MRAKITQSEPSSRLQPMGSDVERRRRPRLSLTLPLVLIRPGTQTTIATQTENVSSDGFYCLSEHQFWPDEILKCEMCLPGDEISSVPEDGLLVNCEVRVVRVVSTGLQSFGVACHLDQYTVSRSAIE